MLPCSAAARSIVLKGLCPACAMSDFDVNDLVVVEPRTWPGMNKPGGVGRVVAVDAKRKTCDVKYVLGGTEKDVAVEHLSSLEEAEPRPRRTTRSKSPAPRRRLRGDAPATATKPGLASERPSASAAAAAEPAVAWSSAPPRCRRVLRTWELSSRRTALSHRRFSSTPRRLPRRTRSDSRAIIHRC